MRPLENLLSLKADMEDKKWSISSFMFQYKGISYIVLAILFSEKELKSPYSLLKLKFLEEKNLSHSLIVPATAYKLLIDAKSLREFFGIEYTENLGDVLRQFYSYLGRYIPTKMVE